MASIGLALVEGEKNANALATGKLSAMAQMAKSAQEADMLNDYWSDTNQAMRDRARKEQGATIAGLERLDLFAKDLATSPVDGAKKIYGSMGYEVTPTETGGFGVYDPATGELKYMASNKNELAANAIQAISGTSTSVVKDIQAKDAAMREMMNKLAFEQGKDRSQAIQLQAPKLRSDEWRTNAVVRGGIAEAGIGAKSRENVGYIGLMDKGDDRLKAAEMQLGTNGIYRGKEDNRWYYGEVPVDMLPDNVRGPVVGTINETLYGVSQAAKTGNASLTPTKTVLGTMQPKAASPAANSAGLPADAAKPVTQMEINRRIAAQKLAERQAVKAKENTVASDKEEYYRLQRESDPNYKPRFY